MGCQQRPTKHTLVGVDYTPQTHTNRCDWVVVTPEEVGHVSPCVNNHSNFSWADFNFTPLADSAKF